MLVYSFCLAGPLLVTSACSENKTADTYEVTNEEDSSKLAASENTIFVIKNDNDTTFLRKAAELQMELISLGKLAQEKGNSNEVKELGKVMEAENTKYQTEINVLAQSKSVTLPTSATEDSKDVFDDLTEENGNDFGRSYSDRTVDQHEDAIALYETAASDSDDPEIKAWATEKLPILRTQLKQAEACKEKSDSLSS